MVCRCSCLSLHQVISGSARLQFEVEVISEISRCSDAWLVTCMLSVLHGTLFETTVEFLVFKFVRWSLPGFCTQVDTVTHKVQM